jgi:hypothetical protein
MSKIELLDLPIPSVLNKEVIEYLGKIDWRFANDKPPLFQKSFNQVIEGNRAKDFGMYHTSLEDMHGKNGDPYLNTFGKWVFHLAAQQSKHQMAAPRRMYWNFYTPNAGPDWHCDEDTYGHCVSVLYNLHTNDGGTEFETGEKIYSKEGQAIVFPSHLIHRGFAPKEFFHRFNLNMIVHIKEYKDPNGK